MCIQLEVRCFANLSAHLPPNSELKMPKGATPLDVINILKICPEEVKLVFVNGVRVELDSPLLNGDRIGLFPAVGGG